MDDLDELIVLLCPVVHIHGRFLGSCPFFHKGLTGPSASAPVPAAGSQAGDPLRPDIADSIIFHIGKAVLRAVPEICPAEGDDTVNSRVILPDAERDVCPGRNRTPILYELVVLHDLSVSNQPGRVRILRGVRMEFNLLIPHIGDIFSCGDLCRRGRRCRRTGGIHCRSDGRSCLRDCLSLRVPACSRLYCLAALRFRLRFGAFRLRHTRCMDPADRNSDDQDKEQRTRDKDLRSSPKLLFPPFHERFSSRVRSFLALTSFLLSHSARGGCCFPGLNFGPAG